MDKADRRENGEKTEKNSVRAVRIHGPILFAECPLFSTRQRFFTFYLLRV